MSKGLEALERFKQPQMLADLDWNNRVEIIEKELKEYELLKQSKLLPYPQENGEEYRQDVVKRLMALEIIKEKKVNVELLHICRSLEEYNMEILPFGNMPLVQEEYDLLKEILL